MQTAAVSKPFDNISTSCLKHHVTIIVFTSGQGLPVRADGGAAPAWRRRPRSSRPTSSARSSSWASPASTSSAPTTCGCGKRPHRQPAFQSTSWTITPLGSRTWNARSPHSSLVSGIVMATPSAWSRASSPSRSSTVRARMSPPAWSSRWSAGSVGRPRRRKITLIPSRRGSARRSRRRPSRCGSRSGPPGRRSTRGRRRRSGTRRTQ